MIMLCLHNDESSFADRIVHYLKILAYIIIVTVALGLAYFLYLAVRAAIKSCKVRVTHMLT